MTRGPAPPDDPALVAARTIRDKAIRAAERAHTRSLADEKRRAQQRQDRIWARYEVALHRARQAYEAAEDAADRARNAATQGDGT